VSVKFQASSDFYLPPKERTYKISVDNIDLLTYVLSHINFNSENYNLYYEQSDVNVNEIIFRAAFFCMEGMDLIIETLRLIDLGMIINRILFEEGIFDYKEKDSQRHMEFAKRINDAIEQQTEWYYDALQKADL